MANGEIQEKGTYQELMNRQSVMVDFVDTYRQTHQHGKILHFLNLDRLKLYRPYFSRFIGYFTQVYLLQRVSWLAYII